MVLVTFDVEVPATKEQAFSFIGDFANITKW